MDKPPCASTRLTRQKPDASAFRLKFQTENLCCSNDTHFGHHHASTYSPSHINIPCFHAANRSTVPRLNHRDRAGNFPYKANGSLIRHNDRLIGSELIGQSFSNPKYFWGRVSATSPFPFNAAASSGSNLGPSNPALGAAVKDRISVLQQYDAPEGPVPVDLVTSSASGLDPHISPAAAEYQIPRVAKEREMSADTLRELIKAHTEGRQFGVFGELRVNVLGLNIALDKL